MRKELVPPPGGKLTPLLIEKKEELKNLLARASELKSVSLNSKSESDVIMLATEAYSPFPGFMGNSDYVAVRDHMRVSNELLWHIPVTLPVSSQIAKRLRVGKAISLVSQDTNQIMAVMTIDEIYDYDKDQEAEGVFATRDTSHPGVAKIYKQNGIYLAGSV